MEKKENRKKSKSFIQTHRQRQTHILYERQIVSTKEIMI